MFVLETNRSPQGRKEEYEWFERQLILFVNGSALVENFFSWSAYHVSLQVWTRKWLHWLQETSLSLVMSDRQENQPSCNRKPQSWANFPPKNEPVTVWCCEADAIRFLETSGEDKSLLILGSQQTDSISESDWWLHWWKCMIQCIRSD